MLLKRSDGSIELGQRRMLVPALIIQSERYDIARHLGIFIQIITGTDAVITVSNHKGPVSIKVSANKEDG